mmetsp:Transcript_21337/g.38901  ORF Transcript_21337/g.38901 Transcript_21337/m.38901 type:complete len:206 (+) Transcript_21337:231-848(+)
MQVVLAIDVGHGSPCKTARQEEDDSIAQVLKHVPNGVHCFFVYNVRPHLVRQHQGGSHAGKHPTYAEYGFSTNEAPVSTAEGQRCLDQAAGMLKLPAGEFDPLEENQAYNHAKHPCQHCCLHQKNNDICHIVVFTLEDVVCDGVQHNGCAIVQERLALNLHCQSGRSAELLEEGNDSHWISGAQDCTGDQAEHETPVVRQINPQE